RFALSQTTVPGLSPVGRLSSCRPVTAPTPTQLALARSSLPTRRVSPALNTPARPKFATVLQQATTAAPKPVARPVTPAAPVSPVAPTGPGGPAPISRSDIIASAQRLLDVPYVWGGTTPSGLDCSAYVSKVWGVARQTTETLSSVAAPIAKDDL